MPHPDPQAPPDVLARRFLHFAEREAAGSSPLYTRLCRHIADDPEALALAANVPPGQPTPNLLLAAVHYLLLSGLKHPLADFYPSLTAAPDLVDDPYPAFHQFCLVRAEEIRKLLLTRRVQTNEVARCACLLPAFALVAQQTQHAPISLIEIGASAGLNLLWDQYGYDYGNGQRYGLLSSPLQIPCALRGDTSPPLPSILPTVAWRMGIDLHPVDIHDPDAVLWLRALIWPEHHERVSRLQQALEVARRSPPRLVAGDALKLLPELAASAPANTTLCIFHSFTVNQFSAEARERLSSLLREISAQRTTFRISFEELSRATYPQLHLITYMGRTGSKQLLAAGSSHGRWLEWSAQQA